MHLSANVARGIEAAFASCSCPGRRGQSGGRKGGAASGIVVPAVPGRVQRAFRAREARDANTLGERGRFTTSSAAG